MNLRNTLYNIDMMPQDVAALTFVVGLNADHEIYRAHFPGQPVTPGVILLEMARELIQVALHCKCEIVAVKNVKFLDIVSPIDNRQVQFCYSRMATVDALCSTQVQVKTMDDKVLAKISFTCRIVEN